jgi:hypothetical protein
MSRCTEARMRIAVTKPLFAWDCLEDHPSLGTIREFLASVPDGKLLAGLRDHRGKGRNDYPVHVCWGVMLLRTLLRHPTTEACLAELRRNPSLARLIGIESEDDVPQAWNMSRFEDVLGQEPHRTQVRDCFDRMAARLAEAVPDLGRDMAGDSSGLSARRSRETREVPSQPGEPSFDEHGLPLADGGRKEYTDDGGKVTKVVEWFGYKFHLLVDVKHEVVLAWQMSSTKTGDNEMLPELLTQAQANLPEGRMRTLAYDKAADTNEVHRLLDAARIQPLIQNRSLWKSEHERVLAGSPGRLNVVYDEAGTLYCYDQVSEPPVRHKMAYIGHEKSRGTLKYRCPAKHEGWSCPMSEVCNAGKDYGLTVRVKRDLDLRRFPPIPRATKKFERMYKGRTAVERVNARLKLFWGADDGNIAGSTRFHALLGTVMIVHIGLATLLAAAPRREGTLGKVSFSPIAKTLRQALVA